ncbi:MAG: BamA/TamA family outer membrane protein, partial [Elusimicrobia bacterium]|nr:BamA/TamA family outer membrane protein [Elusimicrobiota bacterium]
AAAHAAVPAARAGLPRVKPSLTRWLFHEEPASARLTVPILDVDPDRGVTVGASSTWFLVSSGTTRSIHAPAATYNTVVGPAASYDYYLFPTTRSQLEAYANVSRRSDREELLEASGSPGPDDALGWTVHLQDLRDGARRFYGVGPRSTEDAATDYTLDSLNESLGLSLRPPDHRAWVLSLSEHVEGVRILPGPASLPDVDTLHPGSAGSPDRHTDAAARLALDYDTRDSTLSPRKGMDAQAYVDAARRRWLSDYSYLRYGGELRLFVPLTEGRAPGALLAFQGRAEALDADLPFWLMPSLGGKHSLRAYGAGRYVDDFMASTQAELRLRAGRAVIAGAVVSFWVDPFVGAGVVAPDGWHVVWETVRPSYGLSLRAVSRPQVVVSADLGLGQEGPKVFIDMTESF